VNSPTQDFVPRWSSPPGDTIADVLANQGLSTHAFAKSIGLPPERLRDLLEGSTPISIDLARRISGAIGGSVEFWIARDGQYRDDRERVAADDWAKTLPIADMVTFGWIDRPVDWLDQIAASLEFFAVDGLSDWERRYGEMLATALYRSSRAATPNPTTAAWLRRAEQLAESAKTETWSLSAFKRTLGEIRALTRVSDPQRFIPVLLEMCASGGVIVSVVRAPRGSGVSGATRFLEANRPQIILSARYLADDQFWFTFFHEAAHLILHDPAGVYIDEIDPRNDTPASRIEREADAFAADLLVPPPVLEQLVEARPSPARLHQIARDGGIATGILVGQLQHAGLLPFGSVYNRLKRRYRWVGSSLERA
jgi:HTH-type transcriptional regulator/antitoxin HigA